MASKYSKTLPTSTEAVYIFLHIRPPPTGGFQDWFVIRDRTCLWYDIFDIIEYRKLLFVTYSIPMFCISVFVPFVEKMIKMFREQLFADDSPPPKCAEPRHLRPQCHAADTDRPGAGDAEGVCVRNLRKGLPLSVQFGGAPIGAHRREAVCVPILRKILEAQRSEKFCANLWYGRKFYIFLEKFNMTEHLYLIIS